MFWATDDVGLVLPGPFLRCYDKLFDAVLHRELELTYAFLDAGYSILPLMLVAQDPNYFRDCRNDDLYFPKRYWGIDLSPLELMFFKTNREVASDYLARYTTWMDKAVGYRPTNETEYKIMVNTV